MISVIVPAHDEEVVIERCLTALLGDARPGELDVVVVCNGCTDGTADVARRVGDRLATSALRVVEMATASKPAALNIGDGMARGFPRFYVDADVEVTTAALRTVAGALGKGGLLAAAPRVQLELADRPYVVRAYYRMWSRMPYLRGGPGGSGVFGLSQAGRNRFGGFPSLIADDLFVRGLFSPGERGVVDAAASRVFTPTNGRDLVRRRTRAALGTLQYRATHPEHASRLTVPTRRPWGHVARRPALWPDAAVYLGVWLAAQHRARARLRAGDVDRWDRDDSSRRPASAAESGGMVATS